MNSAPAETERIREALLQAAEVDFLQAVGADENPIAFSLSYQRWEAKFLRNPRALAKRLARPLWQRAARLSPACGGFVLWGAYAGQPPGQGHGHPLVYDVV